MAEKRKKVTIDYLNKKKAKGEVIVQIAVYDFAAAVNAEMAGVEIMCVSDTGASILFGYPSNNQVTMEQVIMMCDSVRRATDYGMLMADMPYMSYHVSPEQAVESAARIVAEAGMEVMKCEVWPEIAKNVAAIVNAGIQVQAHVGITPMRLVAMGGHYRTQGRTLESAKRVVEDTRMMVDAGCFSILCEGVSEEVAQYLAETQPVPVISLAAGSKADGVHIIQSDLYGGTLLKGGKRFFPTHGKMYVDLYAEQLKAFQMYTDDVVNRRYPGPEHTFKMKDGELEKFCDAMKWDGAK